MADSFPLLRARILLVVLAWVCSGSATGRKGRPSVALVRRKPRL